MNPKVPRVLHFKLLSFNKNPEISVTEVFPFVPVIAIIESLLDFIIDLVLVDDFIVWIYIVIFADLSCFSDYLFLSFVIYLFLVFIIIIKSSYIFF